MLAKMPPNARHFRESAALAKNAQLSSDLSLIVISHDPDLRDESLPVIVDRATNAAWEQMQEELSHLSVSGTRIVHADGAFLFPQMTLDQQSKRDMGEPCWSPGFIDYLFLAFNTSTAFSPTDTPVLSAWAKIMVMIQALISFTTVALLAARAVNIL